MPLPSSVTPVRAFAQVKFPTAFRFLDRKGEIAEYISGLYHGAMQIGEIISVSDADELSGLRIEEDKLWISQSQYSKDDPFYMNDFIEWATDQFSQISEILNVSHYTTIGLRTYYFEEFATVKAAVQSFKDTFINYSDNPYSSVSGKPTKCLIEFGIEEESVNKNFRLTPIHDEVKGAGEDAGGILYDLDTFRSDIAETLNLKETFNELHNISFSTMTSFIEAVRDYPEEEGKVAKA